ncbi:hypothetical protein PG994_015179, partial [Apiospora phragmitis]
YCGPACQKVHWREHKVDCKSELLKATWRPQWEADGRKPRFMGGDPLVAFNSTGKYLWGNIPAYDVVNLTRNEGLDAEEDLNLLFAASGDLRNVFKTIHGVPPTYGGDISIVLNDKDLHTVARNAITLLLLLLDDDTERAARNALHLWYSAFIPESLMDKMREDVGRAIENVCIKVENKHPDTLLGKTFDFGQRRLRLTLQQRAWMSLRQYLQVPQISLQDAQERRKAVTLAPERIDHRERSFLSQEPGRRFCAFKFREHGILLPFASVWDSFTIPNPTIFGKEGTWPMKDSADPLEGWPVADVRRSSGAAENDIYVKLYYYVLDLLTSVHRLLGKLKISFELFNTDAQELTKYCKDVQFDRIETANIADGGYLGPARTVCLLGNLLRPPWCNPHATLITLFMNAISEVTTAADEQAEAAKELRLAMKYLHPTPIPSMYDADMLRVAANKESLRDFDKYFDRYIHKNRFQEFCDFMQMEMKSQNTIIDKWPLRLKKRYGQPGALEEFKELMGSGSVGSARYVEWRYRR